jgi:hypothetical protein
VREERLRPSASHYFALDTAEDQITRMHTGGTIPTGICRLRRTSSIKFLGVNADG